MIAAMFRRGAPLWYLREGLGWAVVLAIMLPIAFLAVALFILPVIVMVGSVFVPR